MNERLANEKISKLLLSLAIPSILAQMVTLLYNLVFEFILKNGGWSFVVLNWFVWCNYYNNYRFYNLFGRGGAPLFNKSRADENDQANKIISNCFSSLVISSIVIMIVFIYIW
ncbi:MAG: hypothetical protein ACLRQF_03845 [Thomasclavelia ramosa]